MFPSTSSQETSGRSRKETLTKCFPRGHTLSVYCNYKLFVRGETLISQVNEINVACA